MGLTNLKDVSNLSNFDVALSTRSSETTVASILAALDVALSTRASQATLASILAQLDVALSTRNLETTQLSIKSDLDAVVTGRIRVDTNSKSYKRQRLFATPTQQQFSFIPTPQKNVKIYVDTDVLIYFNLITNDPIFLNKAGSPYKFDVSVSSIFYQTLNSWDSGIITIEGEN